MLDTERIAKLFGRPWGDEELPKSKHKFILRANRVGCGYCPDDFEIDRDETYAYFTLHILFSGCSLFNIAGKDYLLKKGDAFIISAGEKHRYCNYENSKLGYIWIEFSGESCHELLSYFKLNGIHTIDASFTEKMSEKLLEILEYIKEHAPEDYPCSKSEKTNETTDEKCNSMNMFELSAMKYTLMMYLLEAVTAQPTTKRPEFINLAIESLENNFTKQLNIAQVAQELHVSHTYLAREFRHYVGVSPRQYLVLKRVEYACHLLDNTNCSCAEISAQCGFYDATHFHRTFIKMMKQTPNAYRKNKS